MKYCRWCLVASCRNDFVSDIVYKKSFRTIDEAVKVAVGFPSGVDYVLYDNDINDYSDCVSMDDISIDIREFVESQRDFESHFYCVR